MNKSVLLDLEKNVVLSLNEIAWTGDPNVTFLKLNIQIFGDISLVDIKMQTLKYSGNFSERTQTKFYSDFLRIGTVKILKKKKQKIKIHSTTKQLQSKKVIKF